MAGRRIRSRKDGTLKTHNTVSTQTSPNKYAAEIDRLKEELKLMRLKVDTLERSNQPASGGRRQMVEEEKTVVAIADSPQALKVLGKGCGCKGKCNTRACGCIKKQTACTEFCKCIHAKCQNQEPDKENITVPNPRAKISFHAEENVNLLAEINHRENIGAKVIQGAAGPFAKRVEEVGKAAKSLFSPDTSGIHGNMSFRDLDLDESLKFGSSKKNVHFESDSSLSSPEERQKEPKPKTKPILKQEKAPKKNIIETPTKFGLKLSPLNPMKPTRQLLRTPPSNSNSFSVSSDRIEVRQPQELRVPSPKLVVKVENPGGFGEPLIDWEEHYAQLVPCKHCKRTFYPNRLEKHESNCKRV